MIPLFPKIDKNKKTVEEIPVKELLQKFGSPLFIFSERIIRKKYSLFKTALDKYYPNSQIAYSVVANYLPGILRVLKEEGVWAEATSGFEYWLAKKLGFGNNKIIFNGPDKKSDGLLNALRGGAMINTDNFTELERIGALTKKLGEEFSIGIRINVATGESFLSRFGFELESGEAYRILKTLTKKFPKIKIRGLHTHLNANINETGPYAIAAEKLSDFAQVLKKDFGFKIEYLNLGGGFAVPGARLLNNPIWVVPDVDEYVKEVAGVLNKKFPDDKPKLFFEPGRYLVDESGILVTTVINSKMTSLYPQQTRIGVFLSLYAGKNKENNFQLVTIDASSASLLSGMKYRHHLVELVTDQNHTSNGELNTLIGGNSCMPNDFISWDAKMPQLFPGDNLIFYNVGAYELSRSAQFIHPRPAVVIIKEGENAECIRKKETFEHMVALDKF